MIGVPMWRIKNVPDQGNVFKDETCLIGNIESLIVFIIPDSAAWPLSGS